MKKKNSKRFKKLIEISKENKPLKIEDVIGKPNYKPNLEFPGHYMKEAQGLIMETNHSPASIGLKTHSQNSLLGRNYI